MSADPLAEVLHQAEHEWRISGGAQGEWQDVLARAAREHIAAEIEALADRLDAYDDNDGVGGNTETPVVAENVDDVVAAVDDSSDDATDDAPPPTAAAPSPDDGAPTSSGG